MRRKTDATLDYAGVRRHSRPANIAGWLTRPWGDLNNHTIGTQRYWTIALQNASFYADMAPLIRQYVRGRTLDLGAGRLAWRELLSRYATSYTSGDLTREHPEVDVLFDATGQYPFADGSFDTIFCCSVLEHAQEPWKAFSEIWRVLAPGGTAIISVPFIYYLHGQPHDYYRFTRYGLAYLAERAGFEVEKVVANGGLTTLLLNIPSVALSLILSAARLAWLIPPVTRFFLLVDRNVGKRVERGGLFSMNHLAVLRKPMSSQ
ncbi:MAG TPA: class I SAM-dependent methyltransferase [Chloroflexia bacterium]|nr:class I SAM-dependent methyltransferase [Chloroflexia bacterium]